MRSKPENNKPVCTVYANGYKSWLINGKLHREDGPAIENANGDKHWFINGNCHREDGPAIENANGSKFWYLNGKLHREDGPAIEYADGSKEWRLNDESYTPSAHEIIIYKMKYEFQGTHERRMGLLQKKS